MDLLEMDCNTSLNLVGFGFNSQEDVFYSSKLTVLFDSEFFSDDGLSIRYHKDNADIAKGKAFPD